MFYVFIVTGKTRLTCISAWGTEAEAIREAKKVNGAHWVSGLNINRGRYGQFSDEAAAVERSGRNIRSESV